MFCRPFISRHLSFLSPVDVSHQCYFRRKPVEVPRRQRKRHARHDAVNRPHPAIVGKTIFASASEQRAERRQRRDTAKSQWRLVCSSGRLYVIRLALVSTPSVDRRRKPYNGQHVISKTNSGRTTLRQISRCKKGSEYGSADSLSNISSFKSNIVTR